MNRMQATIAKWLLLLTWMVSAATLPALAQTAGAQRTFESPEAALQGLVAAAKADDEGMLIEIFGAKHRNLVISADKAEDHENRHRFVQAVEEYKLLRADSDSRVTLVIGADAWPFPIPLVKSDAGWRFDTAAGADEIFYRRIGRNELGAIDTLRAYGDLQRQYAAQPRDGGKVRQFAQRVRSSPGKKDGLYWEADPSKGEELSPIGPLVPDASSRQPGTPYHGYYYKILKGQGPAAPGGRYSYVINGHMVAGFAMLAYPAEYGALGIKSFIVNHYGDVYEKDLGPNTAQRAAAMTEYNPDSTWTKVPAE